MLVVSSEGGLVTTSAIPMESALFTIAVDVSSSSLEYSALVVSWLATVPLAAVALPRKLTRLLPTSRLFDRGLKLRVICAFSISWRFTFVAAAKDIEMAVRSLQRFFFIIEVADCVLSGRLLFVQGRDWSAALLLRRL